MAFSVRMAAWAFGERLNGWVERLCAALIAVLVLDIWFGILARYVLELGITWTEELARYIMIWAALLAVSCVAHRREHIGLTMLLHRLPPPARALTQRGIDLLGIAFFLFLFVYGLRMTVEGASQFAMIFGMTMTVPYASVPVAAALTAVQILLAMIRPPAEGAGPGEGGG